MADRDKKIVVIGGPTATGKTALSLGLAKEFGGEIISADSMQIYRGLDIGTAKATAAEQAAAPHHLVDILDPSQRYSAADFVKQAAGCIQDITARGKLPIITGGTGLYIESLIKGVRFTEQPFDPALRLRLEEEAARLGPAEMHRRLAAVDPEYAAGLHPNNQGRVLRALELYEQTGCTMTQQLRQSLPQRPPYDALVLALDFPDRQTLYDRINLRVEQMVEQGVLEEARLVYENRDTFQTAAQAIGYKEFFPYFERSASLESCVAALQQATRRYAKRQLTWFRRMENVHWLNAQDQPLAQARELVRRHLADEICTLPTRG